MGYMIIDGKTVPFDSETNILQVIRRAGIEMPTFCYYSELSVYGACRLCVFEDKWGGVQASCSTPPKDGMEIRTNTLKLQRHRKMILELLLASHCRDCTTCEKSGACRLQELASRFGIRNIRFPNTSPVRTIDESSPAIIRNPNKCILCGDCVRTCAEKQGMGILDFAHRGASMEVTPAFNRPIGKTDCVNCGQCASVCPTGAIVIRNDTQKVWNVLRKKDTRVIAQVAPAVRVAIGEEFGIESGRNSMGLMSAALRKLGFDEVYDTRVGADLTVTEESKEFFERFENGTKLPLLTSCCPGWVSFVEKRHPDFAQNLSTTKSPIQLFGSVLKDQARKERTAAEKEGSPRRDTVVVAIGPCTAKKYEAGRPEFVSDDGIRDVDIVITTHELATMIKEAGILFSDLEPEAPDMPYGLGSGAGVIFGVTGGVTEAILRCALQDRSAQALHDIEYNGVRGNGALKELTVEICGKPCRIAVVHGLKTAGRLLKKIRSGEVYYDFIEVMACPEGCISGAGQPLTHAPARKARAKGLYLADKLCLLKRSDENPVVTSVYQNMTAEEIHKTMHIHYGAGESGHVCV